MRLFGPLHLCLLAVIAAACVAVSILCLRRPRARRTVRLTLGYGLAANEIGWWVFRYSHEGIHAWNLPLQLCDLTVWLSVAACLTLARPVVELDYFAGIAGAGMALLTPDLWSPWPSYPAIYFFVAHGGIVMACAVLVFGGIAPLRGGAVWRAFGLLLAYAAVVGTFDAVFHTNYMYLRAKPKAETLLSRLGPWPMYLVEGAGVALALFGVLWAMARKDYGPPMNTDARG